MAGGLPVAGLPIAEQRLGHPAANCFVTLKHRLKMHRLPHRPRFDVLGLQRQPHRLAVGAELGWIDGDDCEPSIAAPPRRFGHEGQARLVP